MKLKIIILLSFISSACGVLARETKQNGDHDGHEHFRNEIGASVEPVYFLKEKAAYFGIHVHYTYNIPKTKFGFGLGYERIFDPHQHNTVGIECSYKPLDHLTLNLSPGLKFEDNRFSNPGFALHLETSYEFELGGFHLGPALEIAHDAEDNHLSAGLHFGLEF